MNVVSELVKQRGLSRLAADLGVSYQAVRKWEREGVPPNRVLKLSELSGWQFSPHKIRADIYPHPDDGLPCHLRAGVEAA